MSEKFIALSVSISGLILLYFGFYLYRYLVRNDNAAESFLTLIRNALLIFAGIQFYIFLKGVL